MKVKEKYENFEIVTNSGIEILGVPIGNDDWTKNFLKTVAEAYENNLEYVKSTCTTQTMLSLLQGTSSAYNNIVSSLPPMITDAFCYKIDNISSKYFFSHITGVKCFSWSHPCINSSKFQHMQNMKKNIYKSDLHVQCINQIKYFCSNILDL